jgi:hypothetical protein
MVDETSCPMRSCNLCDKYRKESEKYQRKYEIAKSGLTKEERYLLIELISNEQLKHMIANDKYDTDKYILLEQLKAKVRIV